jgi:GT2 family glycosyltransferase
MAPSVSIILVNYNSHDFTIDCLKSLQHLTYPNVTWLVIDNGSKPGSVEAIRQAFPQVPLIETGANLGFTGGNNVGIRYALERGADYIMLLNNDTTVAPDMLDRLVEIMESDPGIGAAGPMMYYYDHPDTFWSVAGAIDWKTGTTRMIGLNEPDRGQFGTAPQPADFISGCALLARRAVWETVGLLDDDFFMYYEETEWCVRTQRAGFRLVYVPTAMIWHKISIEARAISPFIYYYMTRNRFLFLRKTRAGLQTWLNVWLEYARTFISWSLRPKWQDRRHLRPVMLRAISDYYRRRLGYVDVTAN